MAIQSYTSAKIVDLMTDSTTESKPSTEGLVQQPSVIYGRPGVDQQIFDLFALTIKHDTGTGCIMRADFINNGKLVCPTMGERFEKLLGAPIDYQFADQPSAGSSTAFLIGKNLVLTAAHCILDEATNKIRDNFIKNYRIVFDWKMSDPTTHSFKMENVCQIIRVVAHSNFNFKLPGLNDWALLEVSEVPANIKKLPIGWFHQFKIGQQLSVTGHSSGLPQKVIDSGVVCGGLKKDNDVLETKINVFKGTSGGATIDKISQMVTGIVSAGFEDWVLQPHNGHYAPAHILPGTEITIKHQKIHFYCMYNWTSWTISGTEDKKGCCFFPSHRKNQYGNNVLYSATRLRFEKTRRRYDYRTAFQFKRIGMHNDNIICRIRDIDNRTYLHVTKKPEFDIVTGIPILDDHLVIARPKRNFSEFKKRTAFELIEDGNFFKIRHIATNTFLFIGNNRDGDGDRQIFARPASQSGTLGHRIDLQISFAQFIDPTSLRIIG